MSLSPAQNTNLAQEQGSAPYGTAPARMMRQYELVDRVRAYDPQADEHLLNRAYVYAIKMHGEQKRESGDPYFSHPVEVAGILAELKLDSATIATALLHDTIEDTTAELKDIKSLFGDEIAHLVDGVTKLTRLDLTSQEAQAENFRKLLLATADDIRVLLVKLADRLHNMRTLGFVRDGEKRKRIARETMDIYAPLAGRMGMQEIREEMEDAAFRWLNPRMRETIEKRLAGLAEGERAQLVAKVEEGLHAELARHHLKAEVKSRAKRPYAIWRKIENRSIALEQLSDLIGFRIITDEIEDCYRILGVAHSLWHAVPGSFKDYISTPKHNGYRSLHSCVIGPAQQRVEMQIRTRAMDEEAEYGVAAHWRYKDGKPAPSGQKNPDAPLGPFAWLRQVVEMLDDGSTPKEFLEHTKLELFRDHLFCFTIGGRLIALPQGATPIDFAYEVHTDIGNSCVGAKINGRPMPLRTRLQNGDEVEILRGESGGPAPFWETIAITGKAKMNIRRAMVERGREAYIALGREILTSFLRRLRRKLSEKILEKALDDLGQKNLDDLFAEVGKGQISARQVVEKAYPRLAPLHETPPPPRLFGRTLNRLWRKSPPDEVISPLPIRGLAPGVAVHFAPNTYVLPGDAITGILTPGRGVMVYPSSSPALAEFEKTPERWIKLSWEEHENSAPLFLGRIRVELAHEIGALASLTVLIAEKGSNIDGLRVVHVESESRLLQIDLEVHDRDHLQDLLEAIGGLSAVHRAWRVSVQGAGEGE